MSNDSTGMDSSLNVVILSSAIGSVESKPCNSTLDTAKRLKLIRDVYGFSQRELAKRAGVTNSSISMIEQGQVSPSIQSLSRILAAFPIRLTDFFSFEISGDVQSSLTTKPDIQALKNSHQQLDARIEHLSAGQSTTFSVSLVDSCGVILKGNLQLTQLSGNRLLHQSDSFYIPANQLFRLVNITLNDASFFRCSLFVHKS